MHIRIIQTSLGMAWLFVMAVHTDAVASDRVGAQLAAFSKAWPAKRTDYHTARDESWKVYAKTLRDLVAIGPKAEPGLRKGLKDANQQVRALCARALGYLNAREAVPDLIKALEEDAWPTVRLLAADSLGMIRAPAGLAALKAAQKREKKGDVLLHVDIALRRPTGLDKAAVKELLSIKDSDLGAAKVGKAAPDFELEDSDGKRYKLSSFKGKQNVVLVYLYGDG